MNKDPAMIEATTTASTMKTDRDDWRGFLLALEIELLMLLLLVELVTKTVAVACRVKMASTLDVETSELELEIGTTDVKELKVNLERVTDAEVM